MDVASLRRSLALIVAFFFNENPLRNNLFSLLHDDPTNMQVAFRLKASFSKVFRDFLSLKQYQSIIFSKELVLRLSLNYYDTFLSKKNHLSKHFSSFFNVYCLPEKGFVKKE